MKLYGINHLALGIVIFFCCLPSPASARSISSCWGYGIAEFFVPGAGYGLLRDWEKAGIFGGLRWLSLLNANDNINRRDFEENPEKIYVEKENDGELQQDIFLTRETFYGNLALSLYNNLTSVVIYDLYDQSCEKNPKTFHEMASPFQLGDYGSKTTFIAPIGGLIGALAFAQGTNLTYHVEAGLTRNEMLAWSFIENQLVGIGEEMLFRGVIQRSFYNLYSHFYPKRAARWSSIVSTSVIFGAAHSGIGGVATPTFAFITGMYLGWVYHPSEDVFDLQQAIAIHSWWNTIISHYRLTHSDFKKLEKTNPLKSLTKSQTLPLIHIVYRF